MRIFLSYAWQDREQAKSIYLALRDQGHRVFFDRADLPSGDEYHNRIREAIEGSRLFAFLISPDAVDAQSYTLTELEIAEKARVKLLPVMLRETDIATLPAALQAVTIHRSEGNIAASVGAEIHRIAAVFRWKWIRRGAAALFLMIVLIAGVVYTIQTHGNKQFAGKDGAPAVFIPAGKFIMGDDEESPRREIYIDAFYLDRYEVTVARYASFLKATGNLKRPEGWLEENIKQAGELAVAGVDWHDADQYCRWAGKRLPTEAEWEKAARGGDDRKYPWGNEEASSVHARFAVSGDNSVERPGIGQVGKHPEGMGPFGNHDLAGNAWEWVADWYAPGFSRAQAQNPKGPETGTSKVLRGGGWSDPAERITATKRMYASPEQRAEDIGFRCASDSL